MAEGAEDGRPRRAPVPMPRGVTVEVADEAARSDSPYRSGPKRRATTIVQRWRSARAVAIALAAVAWGLVTTPIALAQLSELAQGGGAYLAVLVALLFTGTAALSYAALLQAVNRTVIEMSDRGLSIRHGPLPAMPGKVLAGAELGAIEISEHRPSGGGKHLFDAAKTYSIHANRAQGAPVALVENLDSREQADFIAGELRRFLARPGPEKVRVPPPPDETANAPSPPPEPDEVEAEAGPDARSSARGHHP